MVNTLIVHSSTRLYVCQCFLCVINDSAHLTSFQLKNTFERREKLVLMLNNLILHCFLRLHISECFLCVVPDSAQKNAFLVRDNVF